MAAASARELLLQAPPSVSSNLCPSCCAVCGCRDWAQFNLNCSVVATVVLVWANIEDLVHPWGDGGRHALTPQVVAVVLLLPFLVHQVGLAVMYAGFWGGNGSKIEQARRDLDDKRLCLESLLMSMLQGTVNDLVNNCNQRLAGYRSDIHGMFSDMKVMFDEEQHRELSGAVVSRLDMLWDGLFASVTAGGSGGPIGGRFREIVSGRRGPRASRGDIEEIRSRWNHRPAPQMQFDASAFACIQTNLDYIQQSFREFDELGQRCKSAQQARAQASHRRMSKHWHSPQQWETLGSTYMCHLWAHCCWYGFLSPCHVLLWVSLAVDAGFFCDYALQLGESDEDSFFGCLLLSLSAAVLALNISALLFNIEDIDYGLRERRELKLLQEADRAFHESLQHLNGVEASLQTMQYMHFVWAVFEVLKWTWFQFREEWRHCHGEAHSAHREHLWCLNQALDIFDGMAPEPLLKLHKKFEEMQMHGVIYNADWNVFTDSGLQRWESGTMMDGAPPPTSRPALEDRAAAGDGGGDPPREGSPFEHRVLSISLPERVTQ